MDKTALNQNPQPEPLPLPKLRKQVSLFIPLADWRALRYEAARQKIPMTELCRRWMKPELERLQKKPVD